MKIPIKWLGEYIDLKGITDADISITLTMSGTENEIVKDVEFPGIVVGEIKEITKHPDANKLQVARVLISEERKTNDNRPDGELLTIVCGAPNIEVGQFVPVAMIGAMIGDFEIKKAKIRGVESSGMLCSESELGISDDHTGIMTLDPRAKIGSPLSEALNIGGTVLEAEITPNRSDCFSVIGIAREASAVLGRKLKNTAFQKAEVTSRSAVSVEVNEKKLCPRYIAKVVEGIKVGPSPKWLQERLEASGVRPISNVVDVTNYVMLEWGQPMHAFDFNKISVAQNSKKIIVRLAGDGEKIETLDGVERQLISSDLVIADSKRAIAIAGVMGGASSEVDEKSTTIILEAAVFEGTGVRKTAQRLGLRTEASNRFEKGIPLGLPEIAIERAAGLLAEIGSVKVGENTDELSAWIWKQHVGLRQARIKEFLGTDIAETDTLKILHSLGFEAEKFDFKKEARKHIGKPYAWGASFRTHGDLAFDCSYFIDYIYSQIGKFVGHTALAQFEIGQEVAEDDLKPGDVLFVNGIIEKSATDHYFVPDDKGGKKKIVLENPKKVGHCALYLGGGRIVHARESVWDEKKQAWKKIVKGMIVEENVEVFTQNPEYLGARRYIENPTDWIAIDVPWWRLDVSIEEDILEELGRIYGYENIESILPEGNLPTFEKNQMLDLELKIKETLTGIGFSEVYNYSFLSKKEIENSGGDASNALNIANPISPEQERMRPSLVPSILKNIGTNQFNFEDIRLFEIARTYHPKKDLELPFENPELVMGVRLIGKDKSQGFFDLKGAVELLAKKFNILDIRTSKSENDTAVTGQSIGIRSGKYEIAKIFVPNEKTRKNFGIKTEVAIGMINLNSFSKAVNKVKKYLPVSRFPQSIRDVNLVFDLSVPAADIFDVAEKAQDEHIKNIEIKDIYHGSGLPEAKKSVTIRMVIGTSNRTLTEEEISAPVNRIVSVLSKKLGGVVRV